MHQQGARWQLPRRLPLGRHRDGGHHGSRKRSRRDDLLRNCRLVIGRLTIADHPLRCPTFGPARASSASGEQIALDLDLASNNQRAEIATTATAARASLRHASSRGQTGYGTLGLNYCADCGFSDGRFLAARSQDGVHAQGNADLEPVMPDVQSAALTSLPYGVLGENRLLANAVGKVGLFSLIREN